VQTQVVTTVNRLSILSVTHRSLKSDTKSTVQARLLYHSETISLRWAPASLVMHFWPGTVEVACPRTRFCAEPITDSSGVVYVMMVFYLSCIDVSSNDLDRFADSVAQTDFWSAGCQLHAHGANLAFFYHSEAKSLRGLTPSLSLQVRPGTFVLTRPRTSVCAEPITDSSGVLYRMMMFYLSCIDVSSYDLDRFAECVPQLTYGALDVSPRQRSQPGLLLPLRSEIAPRADPVALFAFLARDRRSESTKDEGLRRTDYR